MRAVALLIFVFFVFSQAQAAEYYCNGKTKRDSWGFYYPNGKVATDSWGTYYPSGKLIFDSWGKYYPNGQVVKDSWGSYFPNGKIIFDSWGCYSSSGASLTCGEKSFRVRAAVPDFGSVIIQAFPKENRLGLFQFSTKNDGLETYITVDFETKELVDIEMICE